LSISRDAVALAARARLEIGAAKDALGKRDEAIELYRAAIADYQRADNPRGEADARKQLANSLVEQGNSSGAREEYQRAMAIYTRIGYEKGRADIYSNLARILIAQGDRDAADADVASALRIQREIDDLGGQAWSLTALAVFGADDALTDKVMEMFREALSIDERVGDKPHHLFVLTQYGDALRQRGELAESQKICEQALVEGGQINNPAGIMPAYATCAYLAMDRGELNAARNQFAAAGTIAESLKDATTLGDIAMNLALMDMDAELWSDAERHLDSAREQYVNAQAIHGEALVASLAALCYEKLRLPARRDGALARAVELRNRITLRQTGLLLDAQIARVRGESGERESSIGALHGFAQDAEQRNWIALALEFRLAELRLSESSGDHARTQSLRSNLRDAAKRLGFGWLLASAART